MRAPSPHHRSIKQTREVERAATVRRAFHRVGEREEEPRRRARAARPRRRTTTTTTITARARSIIPKATTPDEARFRSPTLSLVSSSHERLAPHPPRGRLRCPSRASGHPATRNTGSASSQHGDRAGDERQLLARASAAGSRRRRPSERVPVALVGHEDADRDARGSRRRGSPRRPSRAAQPIRMPSTITAAVDADQDRAGARRG